MKRGRVFCDPEIIFNFSIQYSKKEALTSLIGPSIEPTYCTYELVLVSGSLGVAVHIRGSTVGGPPTQHKQNPYIIFANQRTVFMFDL